MVLSTASHLLKDGIQHISSQSISMAKNIVTMYLIGLRRWSHSTYMLHGANNQNARFHYGHVATIRLTKDYTAEEWERGKSLPFSMSLWVCETPCAPLYNYKARGILTFLSEPNTLRRSGSMQSEGGCQKASSKCSF